MTPRVTISVIGAGYMGLVAAAVLAECGNIVTCVDIDASRIEKLRQGQSSIFEPGLDAPIANNQENGHLSFTTD